MFRNSLIALEYPFVGTFNGSIENDEDFASLLLWLEDQKIRHYKIEDRVDLNKISDPVAWKKAYEKYKTDLGCPELPNRNEELAWILSYAVRLEYFDRVDTLKPINSKLVDDAKKPAAPVMNAKNPFDAMDLSSEDFEQNIKKLGKLLNIPEHPDHFKILDAAARVIQMYVNQPKEAKQTSTNAYNLNDGKKFAFEDPDLDQAAKILRLLQIRSVRHLQTKINETIVAVQEITANPKTDTKLGKVGF